MKLRFAILMVVSCLALTTPALPVSVGILNLSNCAGGGVAVNATTIDWQLPVGPPDGCIVTGSGTNVTYNTGTLGSGVTGSILDLTISNPLPILDFMTFTGNPNLHFDLTGIGAGSSNTDCATSLDPNSLACSVSLGSPFILTPTSTGTTVTLSAFGLARDLTDISRWLGQYTSQFPDRTPASIQANILSGGSETTTYSGSFIVSMVPEPSSFVLIGGALVGLALLKRRFA